MEHSTVASPPSSSSDARAVRSRGALCAALLFLLEETGFDSLTVKEITAQAGVSYQTFFRHYPDKDALLSDVAAREIDDLLGVTLPMLYSAHSHASAQAICAYVWEHRKLWRVLLTGGAAGILKDQLLRKAQRLTSSQTIHASSAAQLAIVVAVTGTVEALAWWLRQPSPPNSRRMAELLDRFVITPSLAGLRSAEQG